MRIKKISQPLEVESYVIDSLESNSTTNAPSIHAVNELVTYSTEETVVGTWIDGKPLYRKVINIGSISTGQTKTIPHNIENIGYIKNPIIDVIISTGETISLPYINVGGLNYSIGSFVSSTSITIIPGSDMTITDGNAILEYTKTTD